MQANLRLVSNCEGRRKDLVKTGLVIVFVILGFLIVESITGQSIMRFSSILGIHDLK